MLAFCAVVVASSPRPAAADDQSVLVLGVRSLEGDDALAHHITGALTAAAARRPGWTPGERKVSLAQMMLVNGCDEPDAACLAQIADGLGVDRLVYGTLRRTGAGRIYDFTLSLGTFERASGQIEQTLMVPLPHDQAAARVTARAERWVARLAGEPARGTLRVSVNVPGATVRVDDRPVGTADAESGVVQTELEAGQHRVEVGAEGYGTFRGTVSVEPDAEAAVEVELEERAGGPLAAPSTGPPPERVVYKYRSRGLTWPTYLTLGGTAVFTGLTVFAFVRASNLRDEPAYRDYRPTMSRDSACANASVGAAAGDPDAQAANAVCDDLARIDPLRWVFLALTVAGAGTGAYLLYRDLSKAPKDAPEGDEDGADEVAARPAVPRLDASFGRRGGRVRATWVF